MSFMFSLSILVACTRNLSDVVMEDFSFGKVNFEVLVNGLRATRALRRLSLMNCDFDGPVGESLIRFLQAQKPDHTLPELYLYLNLHASLC
jgi:hypothetical protein